MSITVPTVAPISAEGFVFDTAFAQQLGDAMSPWLTLHLAWIIQGIGAMADEWYSLVQDVGVDDGTTPTVGTLVDGELVTEGYQPGYGILLDPSVVPLADAAFLAQFVGVQLPLGVDDPTAQSLIKAESGINRGTDAAVVAAAQRTLTGTQTVYLIRRSYLDGTPNAGWQGLVMLTSECASLAVTEAAVNAVKLGGVQMWYSLITGWTIGAAEGTYATIALGEAAFRTVGGGEGDIPGA